MADGVLRGEFISRNLQYNIFQLNYIRVRVESPQSLDFSQIVHFINTANIRRKRSSIMN